MDRYGPRWIATAGLVANAPVWVVLGRVDHNSGEQKVLLCVLLALLGVGSVLTMTAIMADFAGISYGLSNAAMAIGITAGALWSGQVYGQVGWFSMTCSFGVVSGITAIPAALFTGGLVAKPYWLSCSSRTEWESPTTPDSPVGLQVDKVEDSFQ